VLERAAKVRTDITALYLLGAAAQAEAKRGDEVNARLTDELDKLMGRACGMKLGLWHCFEQLAREKNPRLFAVIERREAEQLLRMRNTLKLLVTAGRQQEIDCDGKEAAGAEITEAAMRPAHTIMLQTWRGTSVGERIAIEMTAMALWPLQDDARMTVLINLLAAQIDRMLENEDQIDALIDLLRMQLRLMRATG